MSKIQDLLSSIREPRPVPPVLVHLNGNPESGSNNHSDFEQMAELARSHARRAEQPYITQPGAQAEWDELEARKMHIALSTMYANLAFLVKE